MSKVWEFAMTPGRLAVVAGCLALAGLVTGGAGFAAGVLLAPRFVALQGDAPKLAAAKPPALPKMPAAPKTPKLPELPKAEAPAGRPAEAAKQAAPPESTSPDKSAKETGNAVTAKAAPAKTPDANSAAVHSKPPIQLDVQVGSFSDEKNALSTVDRLRHSGYPAFVFQWTDSSSRQWHVVQVGPYAAYETASRTVLELSTEYSYNPVIIPSKSF